MKLADSIIDIPEFIKRYINKKELYHWLENPIHELSKCMINSDYETIVIDGINTYITEIYLNENICNFLDFYFNKIKVDKKGYCLYEEELDLPESISNEVFKINSFGELKYIFIDSYSNNKLKLIEIK